MKIHLLRSHEVSSDLFFNVVTILKQFEGPLRFVTDPFENPFDEKEIKDEPFDYDKFKTRQRVFKKVLESPKDISNPILWRPPFPDFIQEVSWDSIFERCNEYRDCNNIPDDEAVMLFTDYINEKNWFSGSDPSDNLNFFVHTGQWEFFLPCDPRFPVAYETIAEIFRVMLFGNFVEIMNHAHKRPRGCVNDFCVEKKDITFKLRTADLCPDCHVAIINRSVDPGIVSQFFKTIDHIRVQMLFRERFKTTQQPSRLEIKGSDKKIFFVDLGNVELKLTPLEKTVYFLFLEHAEGLHLHEIYKYRSWMETLYGVLGNARSLPELKNSINQIADPTENSVSEKISRIRSKVIRLIGEELATHYIIEGPRAEKKKISLERNLVFYSN